MRRVKKKKGKLVAITVSLSASIQVPNISNMYTYLGITQTKRNKKIGTTLVGNDEENRIYNKYLCVRSTS